LDDLGILLERGIHVAEEHAVFFEFLDDGVIDDFRFVLRRDARQELALGLGDPEASNVFLMSSGTSSHDCSVRSDDLTK